MSDAVKERFARLAGSRPPAPFVTAGAIATVGRRRRTRKHVAIAAATAGVVVVGGSLTAVLRPTHSPVIGSSPSTEASTTPSSPAPTTVADSAMLQPSDAGAGWLAMTDLEMFEGFPLWVWAQLGCAAMNPADYEAIGHQLDVRTAGLRTGDPTTAVIAESVERYAPSWGAKSMTDIRQVINRCATFTVTNGQVSWRTTLTVTDTGFGGADSLLVTSFSEQVSAPAGEQVGPNTAYILVVRVGDQIATIKSAYPDPAFLSQVAIHAAARL